MLAGGFSFAQRRIKKNFLKIITEKSKNYIDLR